MNKELEEKYKSRATHRDSGYRAYDVDGDSDNAWDGSNDGDYQPLGQADLQINDEPGQLQSMGDDGNVDDMDIS